MEPDSRLLGTKLGPAQRQKLESLLIEFDQKWDPKAFPRFANLIKTNDPDVRRIAVGELVKIDLERHWSQGTRVRLERYLKSCPELGQPDCVSVDLIFAEFLSRLRAGEAGDLKDFAQRFPKQAAELQNLVDQHEETNVRSIPQRERSTRSQGGATIPGHQSSLPVPQLPERLGQYRVVSCIGNGGMGSVFLAEDAKLGRKVALKVPHTHLTANPAILQRFETEARAAAALRHPNICKIHDVGQDAGFHYMAMEYIEGQDLCELIAAGPLAEKRAVTIVLQLADALQEAHNRQVIHRDLKPSNIRIDERGQPVIMDFGLARMVQAGVSTHTRSGQVMGTPVYMAPEQAKGDVRLMGPCCDIYSLGAVMYELLTGRPPFEGEPMGVLAKVLTEEPVPIAQLRPNIDPRLAAICQKAMAKDVRMRFGSMTEFSRAIQRYPTDPLPKTVVESIPNHIVTPAARPATRRSKKTPRRDNRWIGWTALVAFVTTVVLLAIGAVIYSREPQGTVKIVLNPPVADAKIRIHSQDLSLADIAKPLELPAGDHGINITSQEYETFNGSIVVKEGMNKSVSIPLKKKQGRTKIEFKEPIDISKLTITIDTNTTPTDNWANHSLSYELPVGPHRLKVESNEYESYQTDFTVQHDSEVLVAVNLTPRFGFISINLTDPISDIEVLVDGKMMSRQELTHPISLKLGTHTVEARAADHRDFHRSIAIQPGTNPPLTIRLEPIPRPEPARSPVPVIIPIKPKQNPVTVTFKEGGAFQPLDDQTLFTSHLPDNLFLEILDTKQLGKSARWKVDGPMPFGKDVVIEFREVPELQILIKLTQDAKKQFGLETKSVYKSKEKSKTKLESDALMKAAATARASIKKHEETVGQLEASIASLNQQIARFRAAQNGAGDSDRIQLAMLVKKLEGNLKTMIGRRKTILNRITRLDTQADRFEKLAEVIRSIEGKSIPFRIVAKLPTGELDLVRAEIR